MPLNSGKDLLNAKYITAIIIDSSNRGFFVPIKYVLGDYFFATIEKHLYCFKLDGGRIYTYRHTARKELRFTIYYTDHYRALDAKHCKQIEELLKTNSLPKISNRLLEILKLLGKREKPLEKGKQFKGHNLQDLINMVISQEKNLPQQAENLKNYLERLDVKMINTPVKKLSEFLDEDLKTTDAKFLGELSGQVKRAEAEQKKMSNTPLTAKGPWLKIILIVMIVGLIAGVAVWGFSSGAFNHIIPQIGGSQMPNTVQGIAAKYPTPEALKAAIDRGDIKLSDLPPEAKSMLDNYHPPTITPTGPSQPLPQVTQQQKPIPIVVTPVFNSTNATR